MLLDFIAEIKMIGGLAVFLVLLQFREITQAGVVRSGEQKEKVGTNYHEVGKRSVENGFTSPWEDTNWDALADKELNNAISVTENLNKNKAKNVIMFLGDGLGVSTLSAARIYKAQSRGLTKEDIYLSWEKFPYSAVSRVYNVDHVTPGSASTATALLCGVKARYETVGVNDNVQTNDCSAVKENKVRSIVKESIAKGKWTGVISNTRISHATPAAAYAHAASRRWESEVPTSVPNYQECDDIALQLVSDTENQQIRVILAGGRRTLYPENVVDEELSMPGWRKDNRSLIQEWLNKHQESGANAIFVGNKTDFDQVDDQSVDYLMGIFSHSDMQYEYDRTLNGPPREPSISEMTQKAINILSRSPEGYFLFIESGRIDHAHHANNAYRVMVETLEMDNAVQKAIDMTNSDDTLIVVTADHSHVFTLGGFNSFEPSILGIGNNTPAYYYAIAGINRGLPSNGLTDGMTYADGLPGLILNYADGPGYYRHRWNGSAEVPRRNLTGVNTTYADFRQDAPIPHNRYESHAGEDVTIHAIGPMSHLFHGVHEQNYIARVMMYASCVGRDPGPHCSQTTDTTTQSVSAASSNRPRMLLLSSLIMLYLAHK